MKRENGFINLENIKELEQVEGIHDNTKLEINNKKYYYKSSTSKESAYYEVFTSLLANNLGINTVTYDLAQRQKYGVISEDFNSDNHKTKTINEILEIYNNKILGNTNNNLFNLENINDALLYYYQNQQTRNNIMTNIIDIYFLQAITGNIDVSGNNLLIIEKEKAILAPSFDYSAVCMIDYDSNIGEFKLGSSNNQSNGDYNPSEDISNFLEKSSDYYTQKFNSILNKIDEDFIEDIFAFVSLNTNQEITETTTTNYKEYILNNVKTLKKKFNKEKSANR